ncbi:MAG: TetR family transcriptional regulator [Pseudomonadota bacterium]|nr:TetR family transcriptional regulator [Pseudomonadota bacterium]
MRISKEQAKANREKVVDAASGLFRAHGFDGIAVVDIMKAAGFTHGGFYNHFGSKADLSAEALGRAFEQMSDERDRQPDLATLLRRYLSRPARAAPARTCPAAALAGDAARQPEQVRGAFARGLEDMIDSIRHRLETEDRVDPAQAPNLALIVVTRMAGALALSRAVPDDHPLAQALLDVNLDAILADIAAATA